MIVLVLTANVQRDTGGKWSTVSYGIPFLLIDPLHYPAIPNADQESKGDRLQRGSLADNRNDNYLIEIYLVGVINSFKNSVLICAHYCRGMQNSLYFIPVEILEPCANHYDRLELSRWNYLVTYPGSRDFSCPNFSREFPATRFENPYDKIGKESTAGYSERPSESFEEKNEKQIYVILLDYLLLVNRVKSDCQTIVFGDESMPSFRDRIS